MRLRLALLAVLLPGWLAAAQKPGATAASSIVILDVGLPRAGSAAERVNILIRDDRIASVLPSGRRADAADTIDGRGLFAIPGLFDAHVHLGTETPENEEARLLHALKGGVTALVDMASDTRVTGPLARRVREGSLHGPAIYFTALMGGPEFFTDPRARAASKGFEPGTAAWQRAITPQTDIQAAVREAKATGATAIKLYAALDASLAARVAAEAHAQGLRVFAHATLFPARPRELTLARVDLLAHAPYLVWDGSPPTKDFGRRARGDFLGVPAAGAGMDSLLRLMRDNGVALNPTLWVFAEASPEDSVSRARAPWMYEITRRAARAGVRIVAGTDGLFGRGGEENPPLIHRELELLVTRAGLTPAEALAAATINAATVVGDSANRGSIAVGKFADIILLERDPLADIRNTTRIRQVIRAGWRVR